MTDHTTIEWTDRTWNPVTGCTKVSPGCDNCYAETIAHRFAGSKAFPNGFDVTQHDARTSQPLRWKKPARVFVNSMSDLFHADVPAEFIARVFAVMALTPQHTYQVLTKRPGRMRSLLSNPEFLTLVDDHREQLQPGCGDFAWPLLNVWLGVSVENQKWADIRIPALLETPAAVRFLSCEPLLGPVWVADYASQPCGCCLGETHDEACSDCADYGCDGGHIQALHWVIAGGESGPSARAMHPDWARSLRDQCEQERVPFFFKQWGEWGPAPFIVRVCDPHVGWQGTDDELTAAKKDSEARGATHAHTGHWQDKDGERSYWLHEIGHKPWSLERVGLPDGMAPIRRWGKKRAGRELDGQLHDAFPSQA